jgi:hypothetical protein
VGGLDLVIAVLIGVLSAELGGFAEWLAPRLVRWAFHTRYSGAAVANERESARLRLIDKCPGQFPKLIIGLGITIIELVAYMAACS